MKYLSALYLVSALAACAGDDSAISDDDGGELPLGDVSAADMKADGNWGAALTCKPVPDLPQLTNAKITLSIDGLTLHLTGDGYDKVFPVGPGKIETDPTNGEFGESLSYYPVAAYGKQDFQITPSSIQPCKTWWTDPATGEKTPVFAGLPFMSWSGAYAIHGPIDNFRAPNGGNLRRGYVSHGCFRMEAADVLEVYGRIKGIAKVPVHVQREAERTVERVKVDLAQKWIGAECTTSSDCNYTGGYCATNPLSQKGYCSAKCTSTCADRAGSPPTFCVAEPQTNHGPAQGHCVAKSVPENYQCRPYGQMQPVTMARINQPAVQASVCMPASPGWIGDHCNANADCKTGTTCAGVGGGHAGVCTMACNQFCADQPGSADTFCATMPSLAAGGSCLRQCTPNSNAAECPSDMKCSPATRFGAPVATKFVCTF